MSRIPRFEKQKRREKGCKAWCKSINTLPPDGWVHCRCDDTLMAVMDPWTFTHLIGGILTGLTTYWIGWWSMFISVGAAILFEIGENTVIGSTIAATVCCYPSFIGDNMWNSIFDVIFNTIGGFITALIMMENGWVA